MKKLIYFTAPWCKACKTLEPYIEKAKKAVEVEKIDLSLFPEVATQYGITALPALILLEDGTEVARTTGMSENTLYVLTLFTGGL